MTAFKVYVSKDSTVFCAGHFITYEGDKCEALHGHNYRAAVTLEGDLTPSGYVFDFIALKAILRRICDQLDHRMLLPRDNPLLTITQEAANLLVGYREKKYMFPADEVVILPISNTTAEKLAEWVSDQIEAELKHRSVSWLTKMEVEIEESFGQSATCMRTLTGS
jgi:6-pyruvoyltetrahydropterin/6-carboxytetrahydropterin synthase